MQPKQTTGATISRLAVLTVLTANMVEGRHLPEIRRAELLAERDAILAGDAGVPAEKVQVRTVQRCIAGGAIIRVGNVGIYGSN